MNAYHDAMKKMMMKHGMHEEGHLGKEDDHEMHDEELADKAADGAGGAPSLGKHKNLAAGEEADGAEHMSDGALGGDMQGSALQHDGETGELHHAILKGLADHGHSGRASMGLHERAADKIKEKMASMQKRKV